MSTGVKTGVNALSTSSTMNCVHVVNNNTAVSTMASSNDKLENCEVCGKKKAIYTCPKCEVRSCSLPCVNIHKQELKCDGQRDKIKFISMDNFTDLDVLSDYRLLEEVGRSVEQLQNNPLVRYTRVNTFLPRYLQKLKRAAFERGTRLLFMPRSFTRNQENSTYFNWEAREVLWRLEFIFPQAENVKWVYTKVSEKKTIKTILEDLFNPTASVEESESLSPDESVAIKERLQCYREAGMDNVKVLMKAEHIQKSGSKFYELDVEKSLKENLRKKTIIEFPTFVVILKDHLNKFEIIQSDDNSLPHPPRLKRRSHSGRRRKLPVPKVQKKKDTPVNFFFSENLSDSDEETSKGDKHTQSKGSDLQIPNYNDL